MTSREETKPKRRRRLVWLCAVLVVLFAGYSAGWFWMAERVRQEAGSAVAALNAKGIQAACANLEVNGYPLSFTVACDNLAYQDDARNVAASTGSFYATTSALWPFSTRIRLDAPLRTSVPGMVPLWIGWDSLRGSTGLSWSIPQHITLDAEGLSGLTDPADESDPIQLFSAAKAEADLQPAGQDLDYNGTFSDLEIDPEAIGGRNLPPFDGKGALTLKNGVALLAARTTSLRGQSVEIANLELTSGEAHIAISGPVSVDADGLIDARLKIRLRNPNAVAEVLAGAVPERASEIRQGFAVLSMMGSTSSMPLKIVKGKATLGFIPLGRIKPVE